MHPESYILSLTCEKQKPTFFKMTMAAIFGVAVVQGIFHIWISLRNYENSNFGLLLLSGLALTPLLLSLNKHSLWGIVVSAAQVMLLALAAVGLHLEFQLINTQNLVFSGLQTLLLSFVLIAFVSLFFVQTFLLTVPNSRLAQKIYPLIFGGFYVDEIFTNLANRRSIFPKQIFRKKKDSNAKLQLTQFQGDFKCVT